VVLLPRVKRNHRGLDHCQPLLWGHRLVFLHSQAYKPAK
jgi:hypothetical protein